MKCSPPGAAGAAHQRAASLPKAKAAQAATSHDTVPMTMPTKPRSNPSRVEAAITISSTTSIMAPRSFGGAGNGAAYRSWVRSHHAGHADLGGDLRLQLFSIGAVGDRSDTDTVQAALFGTHLLDEGAEACRADLVAQGVGIVGLAECAELYGKT